jgi:hypothetical protein
VTANIDERLSTPRARNPMDRALQGSEEFLIELGRLVTAAALVESEMAHGWWRRRRPTYGLRWMILDNAGR